MPKESFDVVIIGTGFGGTIAATKLAGMGHSILLLERGTFFVTPEGLGKPTNKPSLPAWAAQNGHLVQYWPRPDNAKGLIDFFKAVRSDLNHKGLYEYSRYDNIHILTANAVGGGSMIYSGVNLRPRNEILQQLGLNLTDQNFADARFWMESNRGKFNKIVTKIPLPGFQDRNLPPEQGRLAHLAPDDDYLYLDRTRMLRDAATALASDPGLRARWSPLELSVNEFEADLSDPHTISREPGLSQHTFCERQGRCMLGCLPQARQTLNKMLFNQLLFTGKVQLKTQAKVIAIKKADGGGYNIHYHDANDNGQDVQATKAVFLAAGTQGSTEILLRSAENLNISPAIGSKFSSNGDFAGFVYKTKTPVFSARGPINTSHVEITKNNRFFTVEDAGIPAMFAELARRTLEVLATAQDVNPLLNGLSVAWNSGMNNLADLFGSTTDPNRFMTEAEMVADIFFFNAMGQDNGDGQFRLEHDNLVLDYNLGNQQVFDEIEALLRQIASSIQAPDGKFVPFPLWKGMALGGKKVVCTHPLGGCPIGADNKTGVVDEFGRVYNGARPAGSTDVLPGVYVVDGSTIPGALAVNPSLTISAQAFKAVQNAVTELAKSAAAGAGQ
jgi:cholesterol oxidase